MARARSGRRADYEWSQIGSQITAVDLAVGTKALGTASSEANLAQTIMRLRGQVFAQLDATAVDERVIIACGLGIVSADAVAAGAGSVPGPSSDADWSWMWHGFLTMSSGAEAAVVGEMLFDRREVDSKAMRRVKPNESLVFVTEVVQSIDQGGTFDLLYGVRVLIAL